VIVNLTHKQVVPTKKGVSNLLKLATCSKSKILKPMTLEKIDECWCWMIFWTISRNNRTI